MLFLMLIAGTATAQENLTLYDGNMQHDKVPFFAYWGDMENGTKSQTIYPDTVLTSLVGKKITQSPIIIQAVISILHKTLS